MFSPQNDFINIYLQSILRQTMHLWNIILFFLNSFLNLILLNF